MVKFTEIENSRRGPGQGCLSSLLLHSRLLRKKIKLRVSEIWKYGSRLVRWFWHRFSVKLQWSYQPKLQSYQESPVTEESTPNLAHVVVYRSQFLLNYWLEASISCNMGLSIGLITTTQELASSPLFPPPLRLWEIHFHLSLKHSIVSTPSCISKDSFWFTIGSSVPISPSLLYLWVFFPLTPI